MNNLQSIKHYYENSHGDSMELFREILRVSDEIGLDEALSLLERCVIEKRVAWAQAHLGEMKTTGNPSSIRLIGPCLLSPAGYASAGM